MKPADSLEQVSDKPSERVLFVECNWEQFHSPKYLAMALSV